MNRLITPTRTAFRLGATALLALGLAGCDKLPGLGGDAATATSEEGSPGILRIEEREVERPDVYSASARGLWDGRFSLGGRWVAVEEKVTAERVRITNKDNGRVIEGALFPREFEVPGPPIMVSMDAAIALDMQAGSPANLDVVVLRTETVEIPAPPPAAKPAPDPDAAAGANAAGAEPAEATKPAAGAVDPAAGATKPAAGAAAGTAIATTALGAIEAADANAVKPAQARIQVAGGANKEGAEAVVARLKKADVAATVAESTAQGKPFYRVVAGPFADKAALDQALAAIRKLGYADAFTVK